LTDLGLSWDQPGPALCPSMTLAQSRLAVADSVMGKWGAQAAEALRHSFGSAPAIVIKDPRIALVLPLWMAAVTRAGYSARCVLVYRNPLEVAASLNKRNAIPLRRAMQLWLHYNLACLRDIAASGARVGALSFHSLLVEPSSTIADAIDTDLSAEAESQISEYIALSDNHFLKP